jgi:lysine/ornithine N-monooxygenase
MTPTAAHDILIIGAGPAGLATAVALQERGLSYVVYERATIAGSTWNSLYPTLKLNTTRFYSHMKGMRFPLRDGIFPSGRKYHDYLLRYVAKHQPNIRYNDHVTDVAPENGMWRVESNLGVEHYKVVVSATGIWGRPMMPKIEGMETFGGCLMHAHDFKGAEQVAGQRVLVVGNGPSGIDIAVASTTTATHVSMGVRTGVMLKRRYPFGLPTHAWMMIGEWLPKKWCKALLRFVSKQDFGDLTRYGIPTSTTAITAYQGTELLDAVKAGKVRPVAAPIRFEMDAAILADGTRLPVDTVIMATGYEPVLHDYLKIPMEYNKTFFETTEACTYDVGPNGQRGFPMLDRSTHPNGREVLGYEGLYVVGVWYKGKGAMYNFNVEADIAAEQIAERLHQKRP